MTRRARTRGLLAAVAALALVTAACGDDDDSSSASTTTTEAPADDTTATTEPKDDGLVSSLQLRPEGDTNEVIERDDPLEETDPEDVPDDTTDIDVPDSYEEYVTVSDSTGALQMDVPVEWDAYDLDGLTEPSDGSVNGVGLGASPDEDAYNTTWSVPGVSFFAQPVGPTSAEDFLAYYSFPDACTDGGISEYDDGLYTGQVQVWEDCGGVGTYWVVIYATPEDGSLDIVVTGQIVSDADIEAFEQVVSTFQVVGPV